MQEKALPEISPFLYSLSIFLLKAASKTLFCFRVLGSHHIPKEGGVLIAANHKSLWDPPLLALAIMRARQRPFFLAKTELFRHKVLGSYLKRVGSIPLKRYSGDIGTLKIALELLKRGEALAVFPEGTRKVEKRLEYFLPGVGFLALRAKAAIVPAFVSEFGSFPFGKKVSIVFGEALSYDSVGHLTAQDLSQKILEKVRELSHVRV